MRFVPATFAKAAFASFKVAAIVAPVLVFAAIRLRGGKYRPGWLAFDLVAIACMFGFWFLVAAATY